MRRKHWLMGAMAAAGIALAACNPTGEEITEEERTAPPPPSSGQYVPPPDGAGAAGTDTAPTAPDSEMAPEDTGE